MRRVVVLAIVLAVLPPIWPPAARAQLAAAMQKIQDERRAVGRAIRTFAIQYRHIDALEIASAPVDLAVIDYRPDPLFGTEWPFGRSDVQLMQRRPGGRGKLLFAYLSVGEAEDYRWYWPRAWTDAPAERPAWIGRENPRWPGNFPVRFWEPAWQSILFGSPQSYLDRIIDAGYDGVYLDRADVYQEQKEAGIDSEARMADLITRLAAYAHARNPRFMVVLQNAEELTARSDVRGAIDMLAKEDLFFGIEHDGRRNRADAVEYALRMLRPLKKAGLPVLLIEYPRDVAAAAEIRARARSEGLPLLLADRELASLVPALPFEPAKTRE